MADKTKILMIEKNIPRAMTMVYLLTCAGYDVRVASTGQRGVDLAQEDRFDLILLDVDLPDMSGFEICRRLNQGPIVRHGSVIFISARSCEPEIRQACEVGAADHIAAPFEPSDFIFRVASQVNAQGAQSAFGNLILNPKLPPESKRR